MWVTRALAVVGPFTALLFLAPLARAAERLVVVELFTSQGCSSCPAADALLGELTERPDVLPLSAHVGYWDYLGWSDPFARTEAVERQRAYAKRFGLNYVYTPQVVVQGRAQTRGSDRDAVIRLISEALSRTPMPMKIERGTDGEPVLQLQATPLDREAELWMVYFDRKRVTEVNRGENGGRQIINYNVVKAMTRVGAWRGDPVSIRLMPEFSSDAERAALLVQEENVGRILGAALVDEPLR